MPRNMRMKRNFRKEVESVLHGVLVKHQKQELSLHDIAQFVAKTNKLDEAMLDGIREKAVERYFGEVLRSTSLTDEHGEEVRRYHSYTKFMQSDDGKEIQLDIWRTIETMTRDQMFVSSKSRLAMRDQITQRVTVDVRYWQENVAPKIGAKPIAKQLGLSL